jgi:hypothetical protein
MSFVAEQTMGALARSDVADLFGTTADESLRARAGTGAAGKIGTVAETWRRKRAPAIRNLGAGSSFDLRSYSDAKVYHRRLDRPT